MEFKGTKGNWEITKSIPNGYEDLEGNIEVANEEWSIACVFTDFSTKEETQANAKLIASAPELLEACESMLNAFNNAPKDWLMTSEVMYAEKQMANAIAKALQP